jgi:hypothetical protein
MAMTIEELIDAEAGLARAFIGYLFAVLSGLAWPMIAASFGAEPSSGIVVATLGLLVVQIGLYVWFAIAAGGAARALGGTAWHYIVWILASPILALIPIPLVSTVIAVSPLSIKFLLGGQLQTAIREQTSMAMHVSA